jgi:hypothetical protein
LQAKWQCKHGEWLPWLKTNVCFSVRTAQAYMRVAERWTELEAKAQGLAHLTFEDGLKLLATPTQPEPEQPRGEGLTEDEMELGDPDNPDPLITILTKAGSPPDPSLIPPKGCSLLFTRPGELLWIEPSECEAYYYVTHGLFADDENGGGMMQGTKRPVLDSAVPFAVRGFGAENVVSLGERHEGAADKPLSYNRWLYNSHEDYWKHQWADWQREAESRKAKDDE